MVWKDVCITLFIAALFTVAKTQKQPKCPRTNDGKEGVHIYNGITPAIQKNQIMPFAATWMDLEIIILSKVSQTEKDKYNIILLTWRI